MDPYEEFARLAGRHAASAVAPRRYTDGPPGPAPEISDATPAPPGEEAPHPGEEAPHPAEHSLLWLAGRGGIYPLDDDPEPPPATGVPATEPPTTDLPATGVAATEPPTTDLPATDVAALLPDPYEQFSSLARHHATENTAPRRRAGQPSGSSDLPPADPADAGQAWGDASSALPESPLEPPAAAESAAELAPEREREPEVGPPASAGEDDTSWPVGERRSAARQARKPLPAALQAAVASGPRLAESPSSTTHHARSTRPGAGDGPSNAAASGEGKPLGIIRRYASAIAIFVLFLAAGGAAAGIAALRGAVQPVTPSPAQDLAAANHVLLRAGDFPPGWQFSGAVLTNSSYGVGSVLLTPSLVRFWLTSHPACAGPVDTLIGAMTPAAGQPTAVAGSQATVQDRLGGTWQIADTVAVHGAAAQVSSQVLAVRSLLARVGPRACIGQFWTAALLTELPASSRVVMTVSPVPVPSITGSPPSWALSMDGVATVRNVALPIHFEITQFASGRAQVTLAAASKLAPLTAGLDQKLLATLAARAAHFGA